MMKCKELLAKIDELNERYLGIFEDVCNIESPTDSKEGVDAVGRYFIREAERLGLEIEVLKQSVSGDVVCITLNPTAEKEPICLSGHIDTVHPIGSFGTPAVRFDEEKIYGPGVCDCKGGVVAALMCMEALCKVGYKKRPVRLLLQTDEEKGSNPSGKATINYICDKAEGSAAFLNLEGFTDGEACLVRKGIATFTFTVHGKEAHSSACHKLGANAILEAAHKIIELEKVKDGDGLTCCCSIINGGTVPNTVPGLCEFKANVRFATFEQLDEMRAFVKEVAERVYVEGCTTEVTGGVNVRVPMIPCERNTSLFNKMNKIYSKCGLPQLRAGKRTGGSDAADVTARGIPCVDNLGTEGGKIHSPSEFAYIRSLAESAKRLASVIYCFDDEDEA